MPSYKLTYFPGRGRGEVARYLFKMNDQEFEDLRVQGESWQKIKPSTPFGQLPLLEVDGVMISQSSAIERLLAKRFGMYGKDDMEQARSDMVAGCGEDMIQAMVKTMSGTDEEKAQKRKKLVTEDLPPMLEKFEKLFNGNGLFVNDKLMWADVLIAHLLSFIEAMKLEFDLSKYEKLKALKDRVESHPKIAAWIQVRPKTEF